MHLPGDERDTQLQGHAVSLDHRANDREPGFALLCERSTGQEDERSGSQLQSGRHGYPRPDQARALPLVRNPPRDEQSREPGTAGEEAQNQSHARGLARASVPRTLLASARSGANDLLAPRNACRPADHSSGSRGNLGSALQHPREDLAHGPLPLLPLSRGGTRPSRIAPRAAVCRRANDLPLLASRGSCEQMRARIVFARAA